MIPLPDHSGKLRSGHVLHAGPARVFPDIHLRGLGGPLREGISAIDFYPLIESYEDVGLGLLWATSRALY